MLWSIIIGGLIGLVAGSITKKGGSMGIVANVVAGLVGSAVGQSLLGTRRSYCSCSCIVFCRKESIELLFVQI